MRFDTVDFNVEYWIAFSEADFIEQCLSSGTYGDKPYELRKALLKEVYRIMKFEHDTTLSSQKSKEI